LARSPQVFRLGELVPDMWMGIEMSGNLAFKPEPAPIVACTISRDVQEFDLLIEDMEIALGENWGDLEFHEAIAFFSQPDASAMEFVAVAVDHEDEAGLDAIGSVIRAAKAAGLKVILIADGLSPILLHALLRE
jgi:pilus assembly protein CpaE